MKLVLRPIPVVFACSGCDLDLLARQAVAELDRRGLAEASVAGRDSAKARARYPIFVVEGCDKGCAAQWLAGQGVKPQRSFILDPKGDVAAQLEAITAELAPARGA